MTAKFLKTGKRGVKGFGFRYFKLEGAGHAPTPWNVYQSKEPFPKGTAKTYGGAWTMYIIFVDAAVQAVNPVQKLPATWADLKK